MAVMMTYLCEAEIVTGLKPFAAAEIKRVLGAAARPRDKRRAEELPFEYSGDLQDLSRLRTAAAVYLLEHYAVPRPKALLGHQHFTRLIAQINTVRSLHPPDAIRSFRISAAGSTSSVFLRLRDEIKAATGLVYDENEADLLLRVRTADVFRDGWEVLARLTPRPLSARDWRVCDMEGALNATIAAAMIALTGPRPDDRVLNAMCGSGTLLVERMLAGPVDVIGGCDTDPVALRCATANLTASGHVHEVDLFDLDAAKLDLPDACLDMLCADLPWGQLVGSHEANRTLYPRVLGEAARVVAPGGRAVFITHEIRLMESVLAELADRWTVTEELRVFQGGLHPRIYLLHRR